MFVNPMKEAVAAALFKDYHGDDWDEATEPARADYLQRADLVMRTMDRSEIMSVLHTLATIVEGVMPLLDKAATEEARADEGKTFRRVTQQNRLDAAKIAVDRAFEMMGIGK
jgi:hypothetical protein